MSACVLTQDSKDIKSETVRVVSDGI